VTFVRKAPADPVQEVAARLSGRMRKAYLDAIATLQGSVDLQALAEALARGDHDPSAPLFPLFRLLLLMGLVCPEVCWLP